MDDIHSYVKQSKGNLMSKQASLLKQYGPWAVVTGASSGIGVEYARQLAEAGFNLVIIARQQRLESLAQELMNKYNTEVRPLPVDLTSAEYLQAIEFATRDLDVGLIVNNAGSAAPGQFLKQSLAIRTRTVNLNVVAPMQLSYHFAEKMKARGRGGVILVSSIAAYMGTPYMANYAATKAYSLSLGEALHVELKSYGIDVQVLAPGATRTEMAEVEGMDMSSVPMPWMNADDVVKESLKALGSKSVVIPGRMNRVMNRMMNFLPRSTASSMFGTMMGRATVTDLK